MSYKWSRKLSISMAWRFVISPIILSQMMLNTSLGYSDKSVNARMERNSFKFKIESGSGLGIQEPGGFARGHHAGVLVFISFSYTSFSGLRTDIILQHRNMLFGMKLTCSVNMANAM
jgi:hypothetical protein